MAIAYSTLLTNYNDGHIISRQIASIFAQEKVPDQVIVCDDGSTDNSLEVLAALQKKYPALQVVEQKPNQGLHAAIRRLLPLATGDYLSFSASDDEVCPCFCAEVDRWLQRSPNAPIVFGQVLFVDEQGQTLGLARPSRLSESTVLDAEGYRREIFDVESPLAGYSPSFFIRRDVFFRHGGWPTEADLYCDTLLNHIIALEGGCIYIHQPCTRFQMSPQQSCAQMKKNPRRVKAMVRNVIKILRRPQYQSLFSQEMVENWALRLLRAYRDEALYFRTGPIYQKYVQNREKSWTTIPIFSKLARLVNALAYRLNKWPIEAWERLRWLRLGTF